MRSLGRTRVFVYCKIRTVTTTLRSTLAAFPLEICNPGFFAPCAIVSAPTSARHGAVADRGWKRPFDDPIPLPGGRQLVTLEDAAAYNMKLPKADQDLEEWQTAVGCLIGAAEGRDFVMHSRIGVLRALNFEPQHRMNVY
jgi:hypothetical protein